jgi:phosphatidylinositol alpha-1,6-mannosyltransferase
VFCPFEMRSPRRARNPRKIIALFSDLLGFGGVQEAGRLTAAALTEVEGARGGTVEFLSLNNPRGKYAVQCGDGEIEFSGFGRDKARFGLSALGKAIFSDPKDAPVILAGHPHLALPASWVQRLCPKYKMVVMTHGVEVWTRLAPARFAALQRAAIVLAPSNYTVKQVVEKQEIAESRLRRLPWPLSFKFLGLAQNPSELPLPRGFPQGHIVLTVGRWSTRDLYKGADALIAAVARLRETIPDIQLVAVGSGDDLPRLRKIAAEEQVGDRVHFLEDLPQEELAACYAAADVFALPSTGEGFGLVFLEAMIFAKPVVGVAAGGATDLIADGINGLLIPPHDMDRLVESLGLLLRNESLRRQMGESGAAMVRREYRFDAFRDALDQILCEAVSERP